MSTKLELVDAVFEGWQAFQELIIKALRPLSEGQLNLRAVPDLRSVDEIAGHMVGAWARWFYLLMGERGEAFKSGRVGRTTQACKRHRKNCSSFRN